MADTLTSEEETTLAPLPVAPTWRQPYAPAALYYPETLFFCLWY
jgi:hypothetical protein